MRPRSLLILALLVLALGAFLWFVERDLPGSEERTERAALLLPDLDPEAVTAVEIETPEARLRLERSQDADAWRLTLPQTQAGPADPFRVDGLLSALTALVRERELDNADPDSLGLTDPRLRARLEAGEEGAAIELAFGIDVPASRQVAVSVQRADRKTLATVDRAILADLEVPPEAWLAEVPEPSPEP